MIYDTYHFIKLVYDIIIVEKVSTFVFVFVECIFRSQITTCMIHHQCSSLLLHMVRCYNIQTTVYRQNTDIEEKKSMYVRASELRKFSHFYIVKLLFLSIFCWYFRYFVGTNDMLVGLHIPTKLREKKHGGELPHVPLWLR